MKLLFRQTTRQVAIEKGVEAAQETNSGHPLSPSNQLFVKVAIERAIDHLEEVGEDRVQ